MSKKEKIATKIRKSLFKQKKLFPIFAAVF